MKAHELSEAIGRIDESLVTEAVERRRRFRPWMGTVAVAAAVCLLVTAVLAGPGAGWLSGLPDAVSDPDNTGPQPGGVTDDVTGDVPDGAAPTFALAKAMYPSLTSFPKCGVYDSEGWGAWRDDRRAQQEMGKDYADGLETYYRATMAQFLTGEEGENRVYSPLNLYIALAMLAETTDGDSRQQILNLLDVTDMDTLRARVKGLWNANYQDDGYAASVLANSLWLDEDIEYVQKTLNTIAENYYASTFQGEMGSADYNAALQAWLNENTGGLLKDQAADIKTDPRTVLALASTIYFSGMWDSKFNKEQTKEDVFHTADGDVRVEFMHEEDPLCAVYYGNGYKAISRSLAYMEYTMWLLLPDEGVSLNTMVKEGDIPGHLTKWTDYESDDRDEHWDYYDVTLSMPKFDVSNSMNLIDGLKDLGITDIFDVAKSDFTPAFADPTLDVVVSEATHAARVSVDEDGCTAAALTVILDCGMGAPEIKGHLDFNLNRPFMFLITGTDNALLFAGAVETPR